jgi:hypothetical protein
MIEIGYKLCSEEHRPLDLISYAQRAEEAGFAFAMISDHYHPWTDRQRESPFVWSVLGALANATKRLRIGTGVTCPTIRIHPAIIAQAAATVMCECFETRPSRIHIYVLIVAHAARLGAVRSIALCSLLLCCGSTATPCT